MTNLSPLSPSPTPLPELLYVDADSQTAHHLSALRQQYHVTPASDVASALRELERGVPAMVITELDLPDGRGEDVCRRAKDAAARTDAPTVLVTTTAPERVPLALVAGCDGVLLKPFAPNLLHARIARLLRARSMEIRMRALRQVAKSAHLTNPSARVSAGTNQVWPTTHCPYCSHPGVINFDHAVHRREWYACLACQKVWIAKSHDYAPDRAESL